MNSLAMRQLAIAAPLALIVHVIAFALVLS